MKQRRLPNPKRLLRLFSWAAVALLALLGLAWFSLRFVPLPDALFQPPPAQTEFLDRNGTPLRIVRAGDSPYLQPVTLNEMPQALVQATLAAEDKRFWSHPGVDFRATSRAAFDLLRHRRIISGASTLTQQLIKQAQPRPRNFRTKIIEAVQALRLEQIWDKQRILTEYLNRIDYGNLNTGCAMAARFYFGKPVAQLSPAECALLAGLPQAPTRLNPVHHPEAARKRQQWILQRMLERGLLTEPEYARATHEPLRLLSSHRRFEAPHFLDFLVTQTFQSAVPQTFLSALDAANQSIADGFGGSEPNPIQNNPQAVGPHPRKADWKVCATPAAIRTSLDLPLNRFAEQCIQRQLRRLSAQHVGEASAVVIHNRTGEVLAMVGSADYFDPHSGQVNGAWAPRSAGSTFKPFTYAIALERGATPATIVPDIPTDFATATGLFSPLNYDRHCGGPTRYRLALANSLNIPAVRVLDSIGGPAPLQKRLQDCGLTTLTNSPEHYGLGLTIGNAEARLLELANAYATLARLGEYRPLKLAPRNADCRPPAARVFSPETCYLIADILSDNAARTPAFGAFSYLRFEFPVACKTGTSSDFRDNWAFGFTPEFTVGVWAGNFDGSPMHNISGVTGAAPILHYLFNYLHEHYGTTWYPAPGSLVSLPVDPLTGCQPAPGMTRPAVTEKFIPPNLPPLASASACNSQGRVRLPSEYRVWAVSSDNTLGHQIVVDIASSPLKILFPPPGTVVYLDPDLPTSSRQLRLQASGDSEWLSDTLQCRQESGQTYAQLTPGHHRLRATNPQTGGTEETWIRVVQR
jgi:penicillin-binding protein 1C